MWTGVGCKMGDWLIAIDIDTLAPDLAEKARAAALKILGNAPRRVERAPKLLMLYRITEPLPYEPVEFRGADGKTERVEVLTDGRQAVFGGIHPATLLPYRWPAALIVWRFIELWSCQTLKGRRADFLATQCPARMTGAMKRPRGP
ncbi:hypothetical protein [Methylobacterium oxalidis]|uniref:DNA primase/polymerase bifunctional N-terminal domain-containing protein n=1 Tax=Methylobacterium oxalidis TaxID=944322 RepID=A0A512J967_9HYPH|nr:hypothetical protein [Methylobacterium oxalidis]GEP06520.1 hypothetical protein MOX02_45580 [Methylobacterium oxalidis]GJE30718.1 hypothetical protein LDDCCGHA_0887 [Methylobacterium oxalidis]GLS63902.1 hypothetical protein GCM10007888_22830 [Methylobacterium oxalidis]